MKQKLSKFILSKKFPTFFIRLTTLLCLICLLLAIAFINKYRIDGEHFYIIAAEEMILSACGTGSIGLGAYFCLSNHKRRK